MYDYCNYYLIAIANDHHDYKKKKNERKWDGYGDGDTRATWARALGLETHMRLEVPSMFFFLVLFIYFTNN